MTVRKIGDTAVISPARRVLLIVLAAMFFLSITAYAVPPVIYETVITDGETVKTVSSIKRSAEAIVADADIVLNESRDDRIASYEFDPENETASIVIRRGVPVTFKNYDGSKKTVYSSHTIGDAFEKSGITADGKHALSLPLDTELLKAVTVYIYDVFTISVTAEGKTVSYEASAGTVGEAVKALGLLSSEDDFTEPAENTKLTNGAKITVHKVEYKERTEEKTIEFDTEYTYSNELYKNKTRLVTEGKNGSMKVTYKDRYVDGKLEKSEVISETVTKEAVNKIVTVGTKNAPTPKNDPTGRAISELSVPSYVKIGSNGIPENYSSVINAKATAYCIPGGTTSTGKRAQAGYIAVDPNEIPYGTEMYIVSADGQYVYGYCIAADTGGFIYDVDWTVDLFMNSESQCWQWGRRDILIYFL